MRTIRKQTLLRAGAALVPAILALTLLAACLPVRTEITQLTAEDLDSTDPKEALVLAEMEDEESTWGTVSRVCRTGLLGAEETYYLVPYLRTQVRDVGTAGSSDWFLEPGLLVLAWQGEQPAEPDRATLEASLLRAEADENTLFFCAAVQSFGTGAAVPDLEGGGRRGTVPFYHAQRRHKEFRVGGERPVPVPDGVDGCVEIGDGLGQICGDGIFPGV